MNSKFLIISATLLWLISGDVFARSCPTPTPSCPPCQFRTCNTVHGRWQACQQDWSPACMPNVYSCVIPMPTCQTCTDCEYSNAVGQYQWFDCTPDTTSPGCAPPPPPPPPPPAPPTDGSTGTGGSSTPPPDTGSTPPTSAPPSSTSTQPIINGTPLGSDLIRPQSEYNVLYSAQTTDSTPIAYFGYASDTSLPPCPYSPGSLSNSAVSPSASTLSSATTSTSTSTTTTNMTTTQYLAATQTLPDINQTAPSSGTAPNQCVARSLILCNTPTGTRPCTNYSQPIVTAINAVCPDGYARVGAFDYEPDVVYVSTLPATVSSPADIKNMDDYQFYIAQGFGSCTVSSTPFSIPVCLSPHHNNGDQLGSFIFSFNEARFSPYPNKFLNWDDPSKSQPGPGVVFFTTISGGKFYPNQNVCDDNVGTSVNVTDSINNPYVTWTVSSDANNYPGTTRLKVNFKLNGSLLLNFNYGHITCTKSSGSSQYYFTTNRSPRALICAKIQSTYFNLNK